MSTTAESLHRLAPVGRIHATRDPSTLSVGLLGCGTVGGSVATRLIADAGALRQASGRSVSLDRIAVLDPAKRRPPPIPRSIIGSDASGIATDAHIDVVIEAIGGIEPARSLILAALENGKSVITANKELMATHGEVLEEVAAASNVHLRFEAAIGGAIPIVRTMEGLAAEPITSFVGILNGTTNFVLTLIEQTGCSVSRALAEAQEKGYAEDDPAADVEGWDTTFKTSILANLAFGTSLSPDAIQRNGIEELSAVDVALAQRLGFRLKLLSLAEVRSETIYARVQPSLIAHDHPLASISGCDNGVIIEGPNFGSLVLSGPGAGGDATAASVISDLVAIARRPPSSPWSARSAELVSSPSPTGDRRYMIVIDDTARADVVRSTWGSCASSVIRWAEERGERGLSCAILTRPLTLFALDGLLAKLTEAAWRPRVVLPVMEHPSPVKESRR